MTFNATVSAAETVSVPTGNYAVRPIPYRGTDGTAALGLSVYVAGEICFPARTWTRLAERTVVEDLIAYDREAGA